MAERVVHQVGQDLPDGVEVGRDRGGVGRHVQGELDVAAVGPPGERRPALARHRRDVHLAQRGVPVPGLDAREIQQVVDQALHAAGVAQDRTHEALRRFGIGAVVEQRLGVA
jgi:hypothetical protein